MIQTVQATIEGIPPGLLMHRFPMVEEKGLEKLPPVEQAELATYRTEEGELFLPAINLQRAFIAGAAYSKGKGRMTLQKPVAACLMVSPVDLLLGERDFELDARPVTIPATKGRIIRYRPLLPKWKVTATLEFDPTLLKEQEIRTVVDDTGQRVGVLDFRPEKKGSFGRFVVVHWE